MTELGIGRVIPDHQERDAIHVAVAPVTAGTRLEPGQHVGLVDGLAQQKDEPIGIVDPFLPTPVYKGQRFWLFLYPGSVTSLRHQWTHPAFPPGRGASEDWLRQFAETAGLSYERLMTAAADYLDNGEYLCEGERWYRFRTPPEFWGHYYTVTGRRAKSDDQGFFACSC